MVGKSADWKGAEAVMNFLGDRNRGLVWQACVVLALSGFGKLMGAGAHAQVRYALEVGAGPVWASHWSPREKPPGTKVLVGWEQGWAISLTGTARLGRLATAEVGILVADKGAHHTVTAASFPFGDMELTYRFRYLEFPATLRTYWVRVGGTSFFTYGGAYVAFALDNDYTFFNKQKGSASRPLKDVEQVDAGFVSGLGFEVTLGELSLYMKYRYSMGFVDMALDTDPVYIPEFRGVDFPVIQLRNFTHGAVVGLRWAIE